MTKKILILILCITMMLSLALVGCRGDKSTDIGSDKTTTPTTKAPTTTQATEEEPQTVGYTLPIVDDGSVTLTFAGIESWNPAASFNDADKLPVWVEFEKRTGVKINWEVMPPGQYDTTMQTRIASGANLPDIMRLPGGANLVSLSQEGIIIGLNDLISQYATNIQMFLEKHPILLNIFTAPDGVIYNVSDVDIDSNDINIPMLQIRKDWLDKLGLKEPQTLDEWYDVLKAFKEQDPNETGKDDVIPLSSFDGMGTYRMFAAGAGLPGNFYGFYFDEQDNVAYTQVQPEFRVFLEWLNKLYNEGLMDPQFSTGSHDALWSMLGQNIMGAYAHFNNPWRGDMLLRDAGVPDGKYVPILPPKKPDGSMGLIEKRATTGARYSITKYCEHPEVAIKWIDYVWATEEGRRLTSWGVEGISYELVDGEPVFLPEFDSTTALRTIGAFPSNLGNLLPWHLKSPLVNQEMIESAAQAEPYLVEPYPPLISSVEEHQRLSSISTDLFTYQDEMVMKFIIGQESLDKFDEFVNQMMEMGLREVLEIRQQQVNKLR